MCVAAAEAQGFRSVLSGPERKLQWNRADQNLCHHRNTTLRVYVCAVAPWPTGRAAGRQSVSAFARASLCRLLLLNWGSSRALG